MKEAILRLFDSQNEIADLNVSPLSIVEEMTKNAPDKSDIKCSFFENAYDVLDPRELSPDKKNLMVFDDILLERQHTCE